MATNQDSRLRLNDDGWLLPIMAATLAFRLIALWLVPDPNFPDARAYVTAGRELMAHGLMDVESYMPLYPVWTWLWGGGIWLRVADIALSTATVWVIYELVFVLFKDRRASRIAALIAALYPHFIFYSILGLTETSYLFIVCGAFLCLYRARFKAGSVLLVLSILIRPTLDLLAPILIIVFAVVVHKRGMRVAARWLATYIVY
jgi:4-amino-4-deoxy-L-arabinose transferase-like glycosyltransferase